MGENSTGNVNDSSNWDEYEIKFETSKHLRFVILSVLIVLMNTFVILLFAVNKSLRKPCNFLLVSLSVSDLLTGLVGLPLAITCSTTPLCIPCVISYSFIIFTSISTVLHILVVSYERYIQIVFPFRMLQIGRARFELKLMASLWFISILIPPIQYIWYPPTATSCEEQWTEKQQLLEKIFTICVMLIFVALPVLMLIYADVSVFFVVRRQLEGIDKTSVGVRDSRSRLKKESRVLILFAIILLYFVFSWSFYFSALIYHSILEYSAHLPEWLEKLAVELRTTSPLVNPILYILLKHDFRRVVCTWIRRLFSKYYGKRMDGSGQYSNGAPTVCPSTESRNVTERTVFL